MTSSETPTQETPPLKKSQAWLDWLISVVLVLTSGTFYSSTLAPTVLDGDAALFQYTPEVLGVTYPTGYPIYILLGKLWLLLFPVGEVAWQMNLFSAVCGAAVAGVLYNVLRRLFGSRMAALVGVLTFISLPTYWRWATEAKIYMLNLLFFSLILWLATLWLDPPPKGKSQWRQFWRSVYQWRYALGAFVLGLQIGVHSTTVLLIPGVLALFWLDFRRTHGDLGVKESLKPTLITLLKFSPFFILPTSSYLYVPIRAEILLARFGRAEAVGRGLVADFYQSGWGGWVRYFTAADFTGGVVTNWGLVPEQLITVYLPLLTQDFGRVVVALGFLGLVILLAWPSLRRRAWPVLLLYSLPIPFVLTYGQGEQSAFLLTSNLVFSLLVGVNAAALLKWAEDRFQPKSAGRQKLAQVGLSGLIALGLGVAVFGQASHNINWLSNKWDDAAYRYWTDVLTHPLRPEAGIMATWGDLTSMWYLQLVENRRPDVWGLYPPTQAVAAEWLAQGRPLYIAGPTLDTWERSFLADYHVLPWGRLVLLEQSSAPLASLLPRFERPSEAVFRDQLALRSYTFDRQVSGGGQLYASLAWESLADLPPEARYSLRVVEGNRILAQRDDSLRSGWFPLNFIPANQPFVGSYPIDIPLGTWPGTYRLQLAVYNQEGEEWPLANGQRLLDLGEVTITFAPAQGSPGTSRFGDELALDSGELSVSRVGQGKGFAVNLLWRTLESPNADYTLRVEMVDQSGQVWRTWNLPSNTRSWQTGQQVRQQIDVILPAEAPPGENSIGLRVSWRRADGSALPHRRWVIPAGKAVTVGLVTVLEKERSFEAPPIAQELNINFEDKVTLVGYDYLPEIRLTPDVYNVLPLTLYWQGRGEMSQVYATFVHLVDAEGKIVAQSDAIPGEGTTTWAVGEYITQPVNISLPPSVLSGTYTLVTGMYLPPQGPRLPQLDANGEVVGDAVVLGEIILNKTE